MELEKTESLHPGPPPAGIQRILIVDDEPEILESMRDLFAEWSGQVEVVTTSSPAQALAMLRRDPADVLIADYRMPEMNGLELLTYARHMRPGTARILFTAYPSLEVSALSIEEADVRKFTIKPLDPVQFMADVAAILSEQRERTDRNLHVVLSKPKPTITPDV
jgi:response regulator RpfG family c-di-GMP phosphodiesterase